MHTGKVTELGLLLAFSLVLSYIETLLPVFVAVPGVKIGLANVVTLLLLYREKKAVVFFFMLLRVFLTGFLFSGVSGIIYGLAGGMFSMFVMCIFQKCKCFSVFGVSIAGGISHNAGQILVAALMMENVRIFYYFIVLLFSGAVSGLLVGYLSYLIFRQMNKILPP
ncbi:MAG: Gx transporter family protein [Clostridium sp.]|nr:Gx transporter family protein [Clostridium sp.]